MVLLLVVGGVVVVVVAPYLLLVFTARQRTQSPSSKIEDAVVEGLRGEKDVTTVRVGDSRCPDESIAVETTVC